jgi:hypothetical protein
MPSTPPPGPKSKPVHGELWEKLVDEAGEEEIDEACEVTSSRVSRRRRIPTRSATGRTEGAASARRACRPGFEA